MADEDLYGELDLYGDLPAPPTLAQPALKPKPVPTPAAGAYSTRARARGASPRGCNARLAQSSSRPVPGLHARVALYCAWIAPRQPRTTFLTP